MGTDPNKIEIVKSCLEGAFTEVRYTEDSAALESRFLFNDQQQRSGLIFTRRFIEDFRGDLKGYVEKNLLPKLKGSPSKIISVGSDGIGIRQPNEKQTSFGHVQITKVRWEEINDLMFVFFGATCGDVVGEP